MHKEIERAVMRIVPILEKNRKDYEEAISCYNDTGYDRYYKKMKKLDAEYEELKAFLFQEKDELKADTYKEIDELKKTLMTIKNKWEYIKTDLPVSSDSIAIDDLFRDVCYMLNK